MQITSDKAYYPMTHGLQAEKRERETVVTVSAMWLVVLVQKHISVAHLITSMRLLECRWCLYSITQPHTTATWLDSEQRQHARTTGHQSV